MICNMCENDSFEEGDDGYLYCQKCFYKFEYIIETQPGVDDEDFIGLGGRYRAGYDPKRDYRRPPVVANSSPGYDPKRNDRGTPRVTEAKDESKQPGSTVEFMREQATGPSRKNRQKGAHHKEQKTYASNLTATL